MFNKLPEIGFNTVKLENLALGYGIGKGVRGKAGISRDQPTCLRGKRTVSSDMDNNITLKTATVKHLDILDSIFKLTFSVQSHTLKEEESSAGKMKRKNPSGTQPWQLSGTGCMAGLPVVMKGLTSVETEMRSGHLEAGPDAEPSM